MNTMMHRTKVRLDRAPTVFAMILRMSFRDFQDLASLKTLSSLRDRSMERPEIPSKSTSIIENITMTKSKLFQASWNKTVNVKHNELIYFVYSRITS